MSFRIAKASSSDLDKFFRVFKKSLKTQFPEYSKNTIKYFTESDYREKWLKGAFKKGVKLLFLAKKGNGEIVGYLMAHKDYGGVGFCNWIGVVDELHGQGVGTALLVKWEEMMKKRGVHTVQLWAAKHNLDFYKNRGYVLVGRVPHNYFGTENYFLYKEIQKPKESNFLRDFIVSKRS